MRYLSVCSGIEAATVAWKPLGWKAAAFAEIDAFPRAVLQHHYPDTPLHGDFTTIGPDEYGAVDLLVGGTPCQSFSVAGLRGGLADDRGNLALEFLRLAQRTRARWVVWENVPGVLSSAGGRDFGAILGGLVELGYGFAYRVLDAQHFGVPQRRRRVFVVGHLGDWRRAAAVLFERHSLSGNPPPRREAGQTAPTIPSRSTSGGGLGTDFDCDGGLIRWPAEVAPTLDAHFGDKMGLENQHINSGAGMFVAHSLRGEGFDASEDGTGRGTPLVAIPLLEIGKGTTSRGQGPNGCGIGNSGDPMFTLQAGAQHGVVTGSVRTNYRNNSNPTSEAAMHVQQGSAVRRLTPRECARLQGFPDDYCMIPWRGRPASECPDGPQYKAYGNSMAVPVMAWIGGRIDAVESLPLQQAEAA